MYFGGDRIRKVDMDSISEKMTPSLKWKIEWDMGVSDQDLVSIFEEVLRRHKNQDQPEIGAHNREMENREQDQATFEDLLDELLDL